MVHARKDYDRIQDPLNLIPLQEPVFLLRGQDVCFNDMLAHYCNLLQKKGVIPEQNFGQAEHPLITSIQNHITLARQWQLNVKTKNPDMLPDSQAQQVLDLWHAGKGSLETDLESYKESEENLRKALKDALIEVDLQKIEVGKALEQSKNATLEKNNMSQSVASMQQQLKHVSRLDNIDDVKEYLASYGKLPQEEINDINREQKQL